MHYVCSVCLVCAYMCIWVLLLGTAQIFFVDEFLVCHKHYMYPQKEWIIKFLDSKAEHISIRLKLKSLFKKIDLSAFERNGSVCHQDQVLYFAYLFCGSA